MRAARVSTWLGENFPCTHAKFILSNNSIDCSMALRLHLALIGCKLLIFDQSPSKVPLTDDIRLPFSLGEKRKLRAARGSGITATKVPEVLIQLIISLLMTLTLETIYFQVSLWWHSATDESFNFKFKKDMLS